MNDARKAPIRPLINRAKKVAENCAALQRRIEKRFPNGAVEIVARRLAKDSEYLALDFDPTGDDP
jgi:hypothetical protein